MIKEEGLDYFFDMKYVKLTQLNKFPGRPHKLKGIIALKAYKTIVV